MAKSDVEWVWSGRQYKYSALDMGWYVYVVDHTTGEHVMTLTRPQHGNYATKATFMAMVDQIVHAMDKGL